VKTVTNKQFFSNMGTKKCWKAAEKNVGQFQGRRGHGGSGGLR
jgi:hypothetical protein